jgi:hypothetical protein
MVPTAVVLLSLMSAACRAPLRPTLTAVEDSTILSGLHGTLAYYQDDALYLVPIDGTPSRRLRLDEKPTCIGGLDGSGRVVYGRSRIVAPFNPLAFFTQERHSLYDVRVLAPEHAEEEVLHGEGYLKGLAVSTDGRVALNVLDLPHGDPQRRNLAIKIVDLNTHTQRAYPLADRGNPRGAQWSRDERSVRYWIDLPDESAVARVPPDNGPYRMLSTPMLCELDLASGVSKNVCLGALVLPVLDTEALAVVGQGEITFSVIDPARQTRLREPRSVPDALPDELPDRLPLIAAPSLDVVVFQGNPPAGTEQRLYYAGDWYFERMWSIDCADLAHGKVATIVPQMHARSVVFSAVDLARAFQGGASQSGP